MKEVSNNSLYECDVNEIDRNLKKFIKEKRKSVNKKYNINVSRKIID